MSALLLVVCLASCHTSTERCGVDDLECVAEACDDTRVPLEISGRYPPRDEYCSEQERCHRSTGSPDHTGCPSTCFCVCYQGRAYVGNGCTAIGCPEGMDPVCN